VLDLRRVKEKNTYSGFHVGDLMAKLTFQSYRPPNCWIKSQCYLSIWSSSLFNKRFWLNYLIFLISNEDKPINHWHNMVMSYNRRYSFEHSTLIRHVKIISIKYMQVPLQETQCMKNIINNDILKYRKKSPMHIKLNKIPIQIRCL